MHPPIDCACDCCTGITSFTAAPDAVVTFLIQGCGKVFDSAGSPCGVAMAVAAACVVALVAAPWCSLPLEC